MATTRSTTITDFALIIFFTYFYVSITFNPVEVADNMKKYGGFIPGIRAGKPTEDDLSYVLSASRPLELLPRPDLAGPAHRLRDDRGEPELPVRWHVASSSWSAVALDTVKQIESQLQQRNYEGFLKQ